MRRVPILALIGALALLPFVIPSKTMAIQILIWGLFAVSYNTLLGYTGLLSFGHAIFFGLGSYATGLMLAKVAPDMLWGALALSVAVPALAAVPVGWLSLRRRGVYFSMLTLAFGQMIYFLGFQWASLTGGDDGLRGVHTPPVRLAGMEIPIVSVKHPYAFYYFTLVFVVLSVLALSRMVESPFGRALQAIRESEERAKAVGYDTNRVTLLAFIFAGAAAGLAGGLNALYLGFVPLESLAQTTGGIVLMMTVMGGKGNFVGPFVGSAIYWFMEDTLARLTESWPLVLGAIFVLVVIFLPKGVTGSIQWTRRPAPAAKAEPEGVSVP